MRKEVESREEAVSYEIHVVGRSLDWREARMLGVVEEDAVWVLARRGEREWVSRFGFGIRGLESCSKFWSR